MMIMEKRLPIKFFSKREEDKQRVEGNSNKELPRWVLSGDELQNKMFLWEVYTAK